MSHATKTALLFLVLFCAPGLARNIQTKFVVNLPPHFRGATAVYLSGNAPSLGAWAPQAIPLIRQGGQWIGWAEVLADASFEYKVNLGDWFHAETHSNGKERPNRMFHCSSDCVQVVNVENFRLKQFHAVPQTAKESIDYHFDFYSKTFANYRHVAVYLPQAYFVSPNRRFPVLYALDGNNLFDQGTSSFGMEWSLDETLFQAEKDGRLPPFIVVGIYSTMKRAEEYLHCDGKWNRLDGQAEEFAQFLLSAVKPFIDSRYRTLGDREHTALLGSSFGGEFGLYAAYRHGQTFSRFGVMSPALWWSNYCMWSLLDSPIQPLPRKLWIDMGDREGWDDDVVEFKNGVNDVEEAYRRLRLKGLQEETELKKWIEVGGVHNELSWGRRAERALKFLTKDW